MGPPQGSAMELGTGIVLSRNVWVRNLIREIEVEINLKEFWVVDE